MASVPWIRWRCTWGGMSTQKGPDLLLEAVPGILEHRPDAKIVFVGDGDMRPYLEHRAWELGVHHAVRFLGAMGAWSDLENLYKSTDVVCVPSRNEPFGMVILEAWAAGKPVVVTENGGPRYFTSHGEDGFVRLRQPAVDLLGHQHDLRQLRARALDG